jgi:hypothetical protein
MFQSIVRFVKAAVVLPLDQTTAKLQAEANEHKELIARIQRRQQEHVRGERFRNPR